MKTNFFDLRLNIKLTMCLQAILIRIWSVISWFKTRQQLKEVKIVQKLVSFRAQKKNDKIQHFLGQPHSKFFGLITVTVLHHSHLNAIFYDHILQLKNSESDNIRFRTVLLFVLFEITKKKKVPILHVHFSGLFLALIGDFPFMCFSFFRRRQRTVPKLGMWKG